MAVDTTENSLKKEEWDAQPHIIVEIVEYVPDSIVSRTIITKQNGKVVVSSFDEGEKLCEKTTDYDTYVQIIDGKANISIEKVDHELKLGEGIIIPAHSLHCFKADQQFKMITTIIKNVAQK